MSEKKHTSTRCPKQPIQERTHSIGNCFFSAGMICVVFPHFATAGGIFSRLEQKNYQAGDDQVPVNRYEAFDELDGLPLVTGYTVSVNDGPPASIDENPEFDNTRKCRLSWPTLAEMVAERPVGATPATKPFSCTIINISFLEPFTSSIDYDYFETPYHTRHGPCLARKRTGDGRRV